MNIKTINVLNKIAVEKYQGIIFDCFGTLLNIQTCYPYQICQNKLNTDKKNILFVGDNLSTTCVKLRPLGRRYKQDKRF